MNMSSETLFRFTINRPPVSYEDEFPSITISQISDFQTAIGQARHSGKPRENMKQIARNYIEGSLFIGNPQQLVIYDQLKKLKTRLDVLEKNTNTNHSKLVNSIKESFGKTPSELVDENIFGLSMTSLRDSIIAIKLLPSEHQRPFEELVNCLRDLEVIIKVKETTGFPSNNLVLRRYRRRSLKLPVDINLDSILSTVELEKIMEEKRKEQEDKKRNQIKTKNELRKRLKDSITELTNLDGNDIQVTPQVSHEGFLVPSAYRPIQVFIKEMDFQQKFSQLKLLKAQASVKLEEFSNESPRELSFGAADQLSSSNSKSSLTRKFHSGMPRFNPPLINETTFRLKPSAENKISQNTIEVMKKYGLTVTDQQLDKIVEHLQSEFIKISMELSSLDNPPIHHTFKKIGNTTILINSPLSLVMNDELAEISEDENNLSNSNIPVPITHGKVFPPNIMDLMIVKQQLIRYEAADISHIENVLLGEEKVREHTNRRESEQIILRETENTTSQERELETTNRFEMSQESNKTLTEDASLKAGLTFSGSYGPSVDFSASAEGSSSSNKQESTSTAIKFSKDITERSSNKITERVLERTSLRVTNEVIDKNNHTLKNIDGTGNISGIYQWINKVYQAQMYNYGLRTIYDFMIPEPAAFFISSLQKVHSNLLEIEKPIPFTLRPDQIKEGEYMKLVLIYGATDIDAPPSVYKTKSLDFVAGQGDENTNYNHSAQILIDDGYEAIYGTVATVTNIWDDKCSIDIVLGTRSHRTNPNIQSVWSTILSKERDSIPFAMNTYNISDIGLAVEVKCQRTDLALDKWRLQTHSKLYQAYQNRLSEYEEKLAKIEMQAGIAINGKNPAFNLEFIKDELKKNCISIVTEQHFDLFNSILIGSNGLPQINTSENEFEGPYVRFFEQAFEWEHLTWLTYPYFWGRKSKWEERITFEDEDPLFNQFLKSGYCRVTVPVRPGFETAIDHFLTLGEIWNGGPLPTVSSPLYVPIAEEISERLDRPGDEVPVGDPWLVRIPTNLVQLRNDDKLPSWTQDENGNWIEG